MEEEENEQKVEDDFKETLEEIVVEVDEGEILTWAPTIHQGAMSI